jgi:hypothetical protein
MMRDNHPGRPAKMIAGKPVIMLDAIYDSFCPR